MLENYKNTQNKILHSPECDTYTYKDTTVKIITVFTDKKVPIALVENEQGEIFEVPKDSLK
jgi:hypothetical protein